MTARLWKALGLRDVRLEINSLGSREARNAYREVLVEYFKAHYELLDNEARGRLDSNPLRILDTKNPDMADLVANAPSLLDYLDEESRNHLEQKKAGLDALGIEYTVNPRLVRGLDYYSRSVFEWITGSLGAQGTICAGGRYDGLLEQLGGRAGYAAGFAIGLERLLSLLEEEGGLPEEPVPHAYIVTAGEQAIMAGLQLAERMRDELPGLRLVLNGGGGSFKAQMKRADRSGARWVLIIGEDEAASAQVTLKHLRDPEIAQQTLKQDELINRFRPETGI